MHLGTPMTRHCTFAAFLVAGTCLFDGAQALTIETDSETNVTTLNTSADELVTLTAEHVAQFGAGGLVKTGAGTVKVGDEMADYEGPITIREGYYDVLTRGALGTADGDTYVDGGTLINHVSSETNGKSPSFANEHIHLKGTGWADNGALQNKVLAADFCRKVTLETGNELFTTLLEVRARRELAEMLVAAGWGTPVGWFCWTLKRIDSSLVDKTYASIVSDYRRRGPYERTFGEKAYCADYLASVALPLQGLRRIIKKRATGAGDGINKGIMSAE